MKGFTILETIINMIIIGIISFMIYFVLYTMFISYDKYKKSKIALIEYSKFKSYIKRDVYLSNQIDIKNKILKLNYPNDLSISYHFYKNKILRKNEAGIDTFHLKFINAKEHYNGKKLKFLEIKIKLLEEPFTITLSNEN